MLERIKWLGIMITIAGLIMGAQAIVERIINIPAMASAPTSTPTLIPSATSAPTKTSTPENTATLEPGVNIAEIEYAPLGNELTGEYLQINNSLNRPVDLAGWTIRDDQKNIFTFPAFTLGAGQNVRVWTRVGVNTTDNLYWNLDSEIWNDGGDCAYLRNPGGELQSYICY